MADDIIYTKNSLLIVIIVPRDWYILCSWLKAKCRFSDGDQENSFKNVSDAFSNHKHYWKAYRLNSDAVILKCHVRYQP